MSRPSAKEVELVTNSAAAAAASSSCKPEDIRWLHGYPIQCFVSPVPEQHVCSICCDICSNASRGSNCLHHHCGSCLTTWRDTEVAKKKTPTCPVCRTELHVLVSASDVQNKLETCKVQCLLAEETACKWTGLLGVNGVELVRHVVQTHGISRTSAFFDQYLVWTPTAGGNLPKELARRVHRVPNVRAILDRVGHGLSGLQDAIVEMIKENMAGNVEGFTSHTLLAKCDAYFLQHLACLFQYLSLCFPKVTHFRDRQVKLAQAARSNPANFQGHAAYVRRQQMQLCLGLEPYLAALRRGELENALVSPDAQEPPLQAGQAGFLDWCDVKQFEAYPEDSCKCIEEVVDVLGCLGENAKRTVCEKLLQCYALASARVHVADGTWARLVDEFKVVLDDYSSGHRDRIKQWWADRVQGTPDGRILLATFGSALCDAVIPWLHTAVTLRFSFIPDVIRQILFVDHVSEGFLHSVIDELRTDMLAHA